MVVDHIQLGPQVTDLSTSDDFVKERYYQSSALFPGTIFCSNRLLHRKSKQSWQWSVDVTSHAHSLTDTCTCTTSLQERTQLAPDQSLIPRMVGVRVTIMGGNLLFTSSVLVAVTACVHQCSLPFFPSPPPAST